MLHWTPWSITFLNPRHGTTYKLSTGGKSLQRLEFFTVNSESTQATFIRASQAQKSTSAFSNLSHSSTPWWQWIARKFAKEFQTFQLNLLIDFCLALPLSFPQLETIMRQCVKDRCNSHRPMTSNSIFSTSPASLNSGPYTSLFRLQRF